MIGITALVVVWLAVAIVVGLLVRSDSRRALFALPVLLVQFLMTATAATSGFAQLVPRLVPVLDAWNILASALTAETLVGANAPDKDDREAARILRTRVKRAFAVGEHAPPPANVTELRKRDVADEARAQ